MPLDTRTCSMRFSYDGLQLLHGARLHKALAMAIVRAAPVDEGCLFTMGSIRCDALYMDGGCPVF